MKTLKVPPQLFRSATMEKQGEDGPFSMSISSSTPYKRYDYWNDEEYWEVLSHAPGDIDESRLKAGLPLLFNHDRDAHLGRANGYTNDGDKCTLTDIKFSESDFAQSKMRDAKSGVLPDTSVGYQILDDGECVGAKDGVPIYKFKWQPFEGSLVTVPADITVGAGRDEERKRMRSLTPKEIAIKGEIPVDQSEKPPQRGNNSDEPMNRKLSQKFHEKDAEATPQGGTATVEMVREAAEKSIVSERKRIERIEAHADGVKERTGKEAPDILKKYLRGDKCPKPGANESDMRENFSDFQAEYAEACFKAQKVTTPAEIGMSKKERSQFSIVKLMREVGELGAPTGLEKEACETAEKQYRSDRRQHQGMTLPEDMVNARLAEDHDLSRNDIERALDDVRRINAIQGRALQAGNFINGGALVGVELMTGSIIDLLRNHVIMDGLGITVITGVVGDLAIPRVTGAASVYWLAEGATVPESDQSFGQLYFTPHRMGADTAYTKQLLSQASLSVEGFVRDDIAKQMAVEEDRVGFNGLGVNGEPVGVFNTSGVGAGVTWGGAATFTQAAKFEFDIENANALLGPMAYVTTPQTKYKLKTTPQIPGGSAFPIYIWANDASVPSINGQRGGMVNGYNAYSTKNVPSNLTVFGVWSEFVKVRWAGIDVVVDPYSLKRSEQIEVTIHQWMDQGIRHPQAFDTSTDAPT